MYLSEFKDAVKDFYKREYWDDCDDNAFDDLENVPVAFTNLGEKEEVDVEVFADAEHNKLFMTVNGERTDEWSYIDLRALTDEINNISFDELVALGPVSEQRVYAIIGYSPYYD